MHFLFTLFVLPSSAEPTAVSQLETMEALARGKG